jgi:uncharacterized protein (TIGR02453 family)
MNKKLAYQYNGFAPISFDFFAELKENNNKVWFGNHREIFENKISIPILALTQILYDDYGSAHIFRPNRDIRFSKNKLPYKTNASFRLTHNKHAGYYFEIHSTGMRIGGGIFDIETKMLNDWRKIFNTDKKLAIKKFLTKHKKLFSIAKMDSLKSSPKGWSKDHEEIEYLRLKHIVIVANIAKDEWMYKKSSINKIKKYLAVVKEWNVLITNLLH